MVLQRLRPGHVGAAAGSKGCSYAPVEPLSRGVAPDPAIGCRKTSYYGTTRSRGIACRLESQAVGKSPWSSFATGSGRLPWC